MIQLTSARPASNTKALYDSCWIAQSMIYLQGLPPAYSMTSDQFTRTQPSSAAISNAPAIPTASTRPQSETSTKNPMPSLSVAPTHLASTLLAASPAKAVCSNTIRNFILRSKSSNPPSSNQGKKKKSCHHRCHRPLRHQSLLP